MFKNCLDSFSNAGNVCVCVYILYIHILIKRQRAFMCEVVVIHQCLQRVCKMSSAVEYVMTCTHSLCYVRTNNCSPLKTLDGWLCLYA